MSTGTVNVNADVGRCAEHCSGAGPMPSRSYLELAALDSAVPCARLHVRHIVRESGLDELASDAELIVSELITNAIQASEGLDLPVVRLWVTCSDASVLVNVWDASDDPPVMRDPGDDEGGRGLTIISAICKDWGWYETEDDGKLVWARVVR